MMKTIDLGEGFFLKKFDQLGLSYELYYFKDQDKMILHRENLPAFIASHNGKVISESYYYLGELQSSTDYDSEGKPY